MKKISAQIIADSTANGSRITSFILTFPRMILAELNTHRMFSRNSASSRAIPFKKMVQMVKEDPFIPMAWQKDHSGMQGREYFQITDELEDYWLQARDAAVMYATALHGIGVTKQIVNRILEPFMWHTVLVTTTEIKNFFNQRAPRYKMNINNSTHDSKEIWDYFKSRGEYRNALQGFWNKEVSESDDNELYWLSRNHGQAEIHMMKLAECMWDAMNESVTKKLEPGESHIPFGDLIDDRQLLSPIEYGYEEGDLENEGGWTLEDGENEYYKQLAELQIQVATARCARISYNTFEGKNDYKADIKLHNRLIKSGHWSPFEHCARAMTTKEYVTCANGQFSFTDEGEIKLVGPSNDIRGWCRNFRSFIQYRALVDKQ